MPSAVAVYSRSHQTVDPRSQRHSRQLTSEAAVAPSDPTRQATVVVDGGGERTHELYIYNSENRRAELTFVLRDEQGVPTQQWQRAIPPGEQLALELESLATVRGRATLALNSDVPVVMAAFRLTDNGRGAVLMTPAPMTTATGPSDRETIPDFISGGGYRSETVLINPTDDVMEGTVTFYASNGDREPLGTRSDIVQYQIPPQSSRAIGSDGVGPIRRGYAVISPETGGAPHSVALLQRRSNDIVVSESRVAGVHATTSRFAIDLRPTLIRHGAIDTHMIVVNTSAEPASATLRLAGLVSSLSLAPGEQAYLSLRDQFGDDAYGIVELESDVAVTVTARQIVSNIRAEIIETELPALVSGMYFPYVSNGQGMSTEFRFANLSSNRAEGELEFVLPDGEPASDTILR